MCGKRQGKDNTFPFSHFSKSKRLDLRGKVRFMWDFIYVQFSFELE